MRPRYLYHLSYRRNLASIQERGLVPRLPDEWMHMLPRDLQATPLVWFTGDVRGRGNYIHPTRQVIAVDTRLLKMPSLYKLYQLTMEAMGLRHVNWWVYTETVPPEALVFGSIAEIRALEGAISEPAMV